MPDTLSHLIEQHFEVNIISPMLGMKELNV